MTAPTLITLDNFSTNPAMATPLGQLGLGPTALNELTLYAPHIAYAGEAALTPLMPLIATTGISKSTITALHQALQQQGLTLGAYRAAPDAWPDAPTQRSLLEASARAHGVALPTQDTSGLLTRAAFEANPAFAIPLAHIGLASNTLAALNRNATEYVGELVLLSDAELRDHTYSARRLYTDVCTVLAGMNLRHAMQRDPAETWPDRAALREGLRRREAAIRARFTPLERIAVAEDVPPSLRDTWFDHAKPHITPDDLALEPDQRRREILAARILPRPTTRKDLGRLFNVSTSNIIALEKRAIADLRANLAIRAYRLNTIIA